MLEKNLLMGVKLSYAKLGYRGYFKLKTTLPNVVTARGLFPSVPVLENDLKENF